MDPTLDTPNPARAAGSAGDDTASLSGAEAHRLDQQTAYLTEALKLLRQGKFEGAGGVDGLIVALQGGQPLDFTPSWPPKA